MDNLNVKLSRGRRRFAFSAWSSFRAKQSRGASGVGDATDLAEEKQKELSCPSSSEECDGFPIPDGLDAVKQRIIDSAAYKSFSSKLTVLTKSICSLSFSPKPTVRFAIKDLDARLLYTEDGDVYPLISKDPSRAKKRSGAHKIGCVADNGLQYVVKNKKDLSGFRPEPGKNYIIYEGKRKGHICLKVAEYLTLGQSYRERGISFEDHMKNVVEGLIQFNIDYPNGHGDMKGEHALYDADGKLFFIDDNKYYSYGVKQCATFPASIGHSSALKADLFGFVAAKLYSFGVKEFYFERAFSKDWIGLQSKEDSDDTLTAFIEGTVKSNVYFKKRNPQEQAMLITLLEQGLFSSPPLTVEKWQALYGVATAEYSA